MLNAHCRKISPDVLAGMLQGEGIADFPKDTLFEVSAIRRRKGEHGEYGELTYVTTQVSGKRKAGKVRVPETALSTLQTDGPCLMFYGGPKTTVKGRTCHDISILRVADESTAAELKMMADRMRNLGPVGIKATMSGVPLDNFPINTLFLFANPGLQSMGKDRKELLFVDFETTVNEHSVTGKLMLPARLFDDANEVGSGLLMYRGPKQSQEGRTYNDVVIVSCATASCLCSANDL